MVRFWQTAIVGLLLLAVAGCSGKPDPVAKNDTTNEPKKTLEKPANAPNSNENKEQKPKPAPKPSDNEENKNPESKNPVAGSKGQSTTEEQLLTILNKGIEKHRFDIFLDEELEKNHKDFFPILLKMAADNSMAVPQRAAAIMAIEDLLRIGNAPEKEDRKKTATDVLAPILRDQSTHGGVRAVVAYILSDKNKYPESIDAWEAGMIQTESAMAQITSVNRLPGMPDASKQKMLPQLIPLMRSPNKDLAKAAITSIYMVGAAADPAIPEFIELLKDPKHPEIDALLFGLGSIGTRPEMTLPVLKSYTEKPDSHNYSHAAKSLTKVLVQNDLDAAPYLPSLKICLDNGNESRRYNTLQAFETLGPKCAPLISTVVPYMDDKNDRVQTQAINVLKAMGPAGKPAVEELKKRLAAPDAKNREELIRALRAIAPDDSTIPK